MTFELSPEREKELIEKVAKIIVRNELASPTILFLQSFKSLAYLSASFLLMFVEPYLPVYEKESRELIIALGKKENIELLTIRIEELEKEKTIKKKA